jgi:hypothetical protein
MLSEMIFYTRPACHLCEAALPHAKRVARLLGRRVAVIDIDTDDSLVVEYGLRVPVLTTSGGRVIAEGSFRVHDILRGLLAGSRKPESR